MQLGALAETSTERLCRRRRPLTWRADAFAADYEIYLTYDSNVSVTNNVVGSLDMTTDSSGTVESNTVDSSATINQVTNFSITKNHGTMHCRRSSSEERVSNPHQLQCT